jgi:putative thiamine transport system substrate-binding protein
MSGSDPLKAAGFLNKSFSVLTLQIVFLLLTLLTFAESTRAEVSEWDQLLQEAQNQNVYFYAWGGDPRMNDFISWTGTQMYGEFGVRVQHIKMADTSEIVSRLLAEKQAGNHGAGSADLIWINGENFAAMKEHGLLAAPWSESLPNFMLLDADNNPELREDFTVPVEGLESPWMRAQLVFYFDSAIVETPPRSIPELLAWTANNPGEFTYPRPPNFLGTTFLKQALLELAENSAALYAPVADADFGTITAPLWNYLDALHPQLLRRGRYFPAGGPELRRLMADSEISLAISFNPFEAVSSIASNELVDSTRTYVLSGGTFSNVSFLAIPFNAQHSAGAKVLANFLLSPAAQSRAQDPAILGNLTVLDLNSLSSTDRALFMAIDHGPAYPSEEDLSRKLPEPHPSWMPALEQAWLQRYSGR